MSRLSPSTLVVTGLLIVVLLTGALAPADGLVFDAWIRLRGVQPERGDIVIVALDEAFLTEYGVRLGELDRRFYARTLDRLREAGVRAVGLDLFFPEGTPQDDALAEAARAVGAVLAHVVARVVIPGEEAPVGLRGYRIEDHLPYNPKLADLPRGAVNLNVEARGFHPVVPLADGELPSFALALANAAGLSPEATTTSRPIDYRGPEGSFPTLSLLSVYGGQTPYSDLQGKIVLFGATVTGISQDEVVTPFGPMAGVEVHANELYTLLHSRLGTLPTPLHALALLAFGLLWPPLTRRKRGLPYALLGLVATILVSYLAFRTGVFFSPLLLALVPLVAYVNGSFDELRNLDRQLATTLIALLDSFGQQEGEAVPASLAQGFSSTTVAAPDMLSSLVEALDAEGGMLVLDDGRTRRGEVGAELETLLERTLHEGRPERQGTMPHRLAEPIESDGRVIGAVALSLPAPLPPHLQALVEASLETFGRVARYQQLRRRTTTLAVTLWPWRGASNRAKIDTLSMVGDLLATERSWLGTLLETLPQAVFIASPYGYIIYRNASARVMLGEDRNLLGALPQALTVEKSRFQLDFIDTVERRDFFELGLAERAGGRPVLLTLQVVELDGEVRGVAGVIGDLSSVEQMARLRQEFSAMLIHDLRSPLTSIMGFAELIREETEDLQARGYADIIRSESERMKRLTDSFLMMSRLSSDNMELDLEVVDAASLLRQAVAGASGAAAKKGITIALDAPLAYLATIDADLVARALANLLSNAVKYSPGHTRIGVTLEPDAERFVLEVSDQGFGLSEKQQAGLFQKYGRIREGPHQKVEGTGLGLYLVKRVVEAHGGEIELVSAPGEGSTFRLVLPRREATTHPGSL